MRVERLSVMQVEKCKQSVIADPLSAYTQCH